jgi:nucleolar protein 56
MTANSYINHVENLGVLSEDLNLFLETNLPKPEKKGKKDSFVLGVSEPKLGASISEILGVTCQHAGVIPEIVRGIRSHFAQLVKGNLLSTQNYAFKIKNIYILGFTVQTSGVAQLGLGHSYSRAKVKFNVHRVDNMIIQSIALLDQLDKDINTFSMRIRLVLLFKLLYFKLNLHLNSH